MCIDKKSLAAPHRSSRNDYGATRSGGGDRLAYVGKRRAAGINSRRLPRARHGQKQCSEKGAESARHGATWLEKRRIIWPQPKWRIGIGKPMASGPTSATRCFLKFARTATGQC